MTKYAPIPENPKASVRAGFMLQLAGQRHQREVNAALKPYGLTFVHCQLLFGLYHLTQDGEKVNQNQLIQFVELNKAMVSTVLKKLVSNGLIERKEDASDSRAKNLFLTKKGFTAVEQTYSIVEQVDSRLFTRPGLDLEHLVDMLHIVLDKPIRPCCMNNHSADGGKTTLQSPE